MHRVVNFALSLLLIACAPVFAQQAPLVCDADSDRDIDRNDIALINAARNQPASGPADPRDPDRNGVITVNDARICTQRCTLSQCAVPATNRTPGADAGADQTVFAGAVVTLSGAASSDPDGNSLSYRWRLVSIPSGSTAVLSDPTLVSPTFTADLEGQYRVELIVNDSRVDSAPDEVLINTIPRNTNPVANAGADQMVFTGQLVQLDGSASSDVDGDALQFTWALTTAPSGSTASLSDVHDVQPTFVPDAPGLYRIALTVNDGRGGIVSDSVDVTTQQGNRAPLADAGADQVAIVGQTVLLDGIGSSDPDANALSFRWSFASRPAGSTSALTGALTRTPGFVADRAGDYIVQ
ncbi:MAG: PKD domain-containing protein, partial [Steroidobacter sp.]